MITTGPAGLVRRWVRLYTQGLAPEVRDRRRDEIDADLWSQLEEAAAFGRSIRSTNAEVLTRWLAGIPADLSWRMEHRRGGEMPQLGMALRGVAIGGLMMFGGLALVGLFFRYSEVSTDNILIWIGSAGDLAIAGALGGLVVRFRDRLDDQVAVAGWLGALAAALGAVLYFMVFFLPLLTVPLVLNLARVGVIGRWLAAVHVAAAGLYVLVILIGLSGARSAELAYAVLSYPLSLVLLGLSLVGGALRPQRAATAA